MSVYGSRYARALADVVLSQKLKPSDVDQQLRDFSGTWHGSAQLREMLVNPAIPIEEKVGMLDKLNTRIGLSQPVRNFLAVLINHDRLSALDEVLEAYHKEMNSRLGIAEAHVTTARKLDDAERRELQDQMAHISGSQVEASFKEDSSILGGAIVRIGSTVYDGSVRGRLNKLKEQLIAG